jgi:nucleotide-binding universal stress UspA family protein
VEYDIKTILYATDLGPSGPEVVNHAVGLARRFDARIHAIHVTEPMSRFSNTLVEKYLPKDSVNKFREQALEEARRELEERARDYFRKHLFADTDAEHLFADIRVVEGSPATSILKEAERIDADLIVLGDRGYSPLNELLIGSVAHKVMMTAKTPVLLVPISD